MPLIKLNDRSIKDVTSLPFGVGTLVHIQSQTASNSASISFTTGINSTYKEYQFYFIDINPATDGAFFQFQSSIDSGSNYNVTLTSTLFNAQHSEAGTDAGIGYQSTMDQAQGTSFQSITNRIGSGADESGAGFLQLFNPASTTYVKHFIANSGILHYEDYCIPSYTAGYFNTTSAINAVQFKMNTGNFDGTIAMFGVL